MDDKRQTIRFPGEVVKGILDFRKGDSAWSGLSFSAKVIAMLKELIKLEVRSPPPAQGMAALLDGHTDHDIAVETTLTQGRVAEIRGGALLTDGEIIQLARYLDIGAEELMPYREVRKEPQHKENGSHEHEKKNCH